MPAEELANGNAAVLREDLFAAVGCEGNEIVVYFPDGSVRTVRVS